jgi:hypothetical protein
VSTTPGAEVLVDGEPKGPANAEITGLKPGSHYVEVRAQGYQSTTVEQQVVAGEQRIAKVELQPQVEKPKTASLRVVTMVPDADVFLDGAAVGKAPFDHNDLQPGKHFVVVKKVGFADWKREVDLDPTRPTMLTAELSASGTIKVLSNVAGAVVYLDGQVVGKTPLTLDSVAAGDHLLEVKQSGYVAAKQPIHIEGGDQKILSADLARIQSGPSASDILRRKHSMSSFSAVTLDPGRFTADLAVGYVPFAQARLTVGALRQGWLGLDAGIELRSIGYFTDFGAHAKLQVVRADPIAVAVDAYFGGGGGPTKRNDYGFEIGVPITLIFGDLVRFTAHPYLQWYSDRNCPTVQDIYNDDQLNGTPTTSPAAGSGSLFAQERQACKQDNAIGKRDDGTPYPLPPGTDPTVYRFGDPRNRFENARFMIQGVLEIVLLPAVNLFILLEGDPIGAFSGLQTQRQSLTSKFSDAFPTTDTYVYGRIGLTFKF